MDATACARMSAAQSGRCPLLVLPRAVGLREADRARAVTGGAGVGLVGEEHAMPHVAAVGDGAQGGPAVEPPVDAAAPMSAESPRGFTRDESPVGSEQRVRRRLAQQAVNDSGRNSMTVENCCAIASRPIPKLFIPSAYLAV